MSWCGGGRNQAHAGHRVAQLADVVGHLAARQLASFAGLGALGHLDLDLVSAGQVLGGYAETAGGHLLDARTQRVAILQRQIDLDVFGADHALEAVAFLDRDALELVAIARRVFAAFTGVALAADAVHGHGQRGVGLGGDGAQRHGTGGEALDDFLGRLDLVDRNRLGRVDLELEQAAQRHVARLWSLMIWAYSL
jgi:hypothetical protein